MATNPEAGLDSVPEVVTRDMDLDRLADWVGGVAAPPVHERFISAELTAPLPLLERGLVVIDTPPVGGGMASTAAASTLKALSGVDAAVFVTDASQELTAPEVEVLRHALDLGTRVLVVMTKVDFYPDWRLITKLDTEHLERLGIDSEFVPVSSPMWHAGLMSEDRELARGSGVPDLTNWVSAVVLGHTERRVVAQSAAAVVAVADQLHGTAQAEREALTDPSNARSMMSDLELARARAEAMQGEAARWQQRLNDEISDVLSDVEHDLGRRFLAIDAEASEVLAGGDPAELWPEFEPWLYRRTNEDVLANYQYLLDRADKISDAISELFFLEEQEVLDEMRAATPDQRLAEVRLSGDVDLERMSRSRGRLHGASWVGGQCGDRRHGGRVCRHPGTDSGTDCRLECSGAGGCARSALRQGREGGRPGEAATRGAGRLSEVPRAGQVRRAEGVSGHCSPRSQDHSRPLRGPGR